ncbi:MAG: trypsin-like peptidase domain-containing protein [Flavobacteriales bacterium]|jgi:lysyl endopeptidase|nr:trypsin-like peptidase domain-containing protein [Flavobacteriales bacterium]MBK7103507.1 trypsin-like peptidase domain-containing protein [Flavobacteriales bacterium]MBK7112433.1 trypsin-like peptidase domain-containing protein [Flavobacteriales bacterium]MBK7481563.1 trypsin-like peptidase domain-containing protein [Flavobacteriales bacterium]MBK7620321.1 trypsin-like peptidase domain-containing protein [Flavobacteriales bacterium]
MKDLKTKFWISCSLILLCSSGQAQIGYGGRPIGLSRGASLLTPTHAVTLPTVDHASLIQADEAAMATGVKGPYRFGYNHATDLGMRTHGTWTTLRNGDRVWQLSIHCPGALSINFVFDRFVIPEGAKVYVYTPEQVQLGAFDQSSNGGRSSMGVTQLPGERITIEYQEPAAVAGQGELHIDQVTHGYRDIFAMARDLGESGACNINVICPEGDDWRDQIRSVAILTTGGSGFCTGSLVNNCAEDGTPYFLTANHCLDEDVENWVFRFNWDSPVCDPTENGPMDQTVSGCTLLANSGGTDVALLELNTVPPEEYDVYYSGWDHSTTPAQNMTGIHHPRGDIKKISHSDGSAVLGTFLGADCWRVSVWNDGTTEPGSSGSGLWNQNKQLVGQLYGGAANCANSVDDYYGRLDVSWPLIEQWLGNTCGDTLGGWEPNEVVPIVFDAAVTSITQIAELQCGEDTITPVFTLKNNGTVPLTDATITYGMVGGDPYVFEWSGNLLPGQTGTVGLPAIPLLSGENILTVNCSAPNGGADQVPLNDTWSFTFTASTPAALVSLILTLDNYGSDVTWDLQTETGVELYSGGPYSDMENGVVDSVAFCLSNGCYTFTINDVYGDGICCTEGDGELVIRDEFGFVFVESDGQYGDGFSTDLCLVDVAVNELDPTTAIRIQPNPSGGLFTLDLSPFTGRVQVTVLDAVGRSVRRFVVPGGMANTKLDLQSGSAGTYLVLLDHAGGRAMQRIVVEH